MRETMTIKLQIDIKCCFNILKLWTLPFHENSKIFYKNSLLLLHESSLLFIVCCLRWFVIVIGVSGATRLYHRSSLLIRHYHMPHPLCHFPHPNPGPYANLGWVVQYIIDFFLCYLHVVILYSFYFGWARWFWVWVCLIHNNLV